MTTYTRNFGDYTHKLTITEDAPNISKNTSLVRWRYDITGSGTAWNSDGANWSVTINGSKKSGTKGYHFPGSNPLAVSSGTLTVAHNSDGRKTISVNAYWPYQTSGMPGGTVSGNFKLTDIGRKSSPTVISSSLDAGTQQTILFHRASDTFTHTVTYTFGSVSGTIVTKTSIADYNWTPPLSMLTGIPSSTSGTCTLTVTTYSGSTSLGSNTVSFTLKAPTSVVPTIGSVTGQEASPAVISVINKFVQGNSKILAKINSVSEAYSSPITTYKIEIGTQVFSSASATSAILVNSGTIAVKGTVTDARGRSATKTINISVLAYAPPKINVLAIERALSNGTPAAEGTYAKVTMAVVASSLKDGTLEKNTLAYSISSRQRNGSNFTVKSSGAIGLTYSAAKVVGIYAIDLGWDFLTSFEDKFTISSKLSTLSTSAIFMHWGVGLGLGKYWARGMLDVAGDAYVSGKVTAGSIDAPNAFIDRSASSQNWDIVYTPGTYAMNPGFWGSGLPSSGEEPQQYGQLLIFAVAGNVTQMYIPNSAQGRVWSRQKWASSNSWIDWTMIGPRVATGTADSPNLAVDGGAITTITFPVGRFTVPPTVTTGAANGRINMSVTNITTTSAIIGFNNWSSGKPGVVYGNMWTATEVN